MRFSFVALAAVALVVVSALAEETCKAKYTCLKKDEACDPTSTDHICQVGLYCVDKKCVVDTLEAKCDTALDCKGPEHESGIAYRCDNGKCKLLGLHGDGCEADADCILSKCKDSICTGKESGETCATSLECHTGLYCKGFKCTAGTGDVDASCDEDRECKYGLQCDAETKKCYKLFSYEEGTKCKALGFMCKTDLYCNKDGKCAKGEKFDVKLKKCTGDSDCTAKGTKCLCNEYSGEKYCTLVEYPENNTRCAKETKSYWECLAKNKCREGIPASKLADKTCVAKHCKNKARDTVRCGFDCLGARMYGDCISKDTKNFYCAPRSTTLIIVGVVLAVIIVVAIIIICYCCCCRKD